MPIPKEEGLKIIKKANLRFGFDEEKSELRCVELYSEDLEAQTKIAEEIAEEFGLKAIWQNFGPGEGVSQQKWEFVFVAICHTLEELKEAPEKINKACQKLQARLEKLNKAIAKLSSSEK